MARSFLSVGTVARLHLRGSQAGSLAIARQSGRQTRQSLDQLMSDHLRFTCHAISVLPGSTAMTILMRGPGKIEPAESPCLKSVDYWPKFADPGHHSMDSVTSCRCARREFSRGFCCCLK